jgi:surfeit locus 1 family protein
MKRRHGPGLIILAIMPLCAFALGTWQIFRLDQKVEMIARFSDQLARPPLALPPVVDPEAVKEFDHRRVYMVGRFRHDQEMLVGPRMRDGKEGYIVITPLEREDGSTILVSRGWIEKKFKEQRSRPMPEGPTKVEGLLRVPIPKNMFTPNNKPETGEFFFPDIKQMAELTGSQPIWVEETMVQDLTLFYYREDKGIPIGRGAEVALRNNHVQYIVTWYALAIATSVMFYMVVKRPAMDPSKRVRASRGW